MNEDEMMYLDEAICYLELAMETGQNTEFYKNIIYDLKTQLKELKGE